jgi:nucleoside-diphosphate-sugar epimerase
MGLPPLSSGGVATAKLVAAVMKPVRTTAKFALGKFKKQIMGLYQRSALAKKAMKSAEQAIRQSPSANEFRLYGKKLSLSTAKAEALIGYRPGFTMDDGLALSAAWLEHHGYVHR